MQKEDYHIIIGDDIRVAFHTILPNNNINSILNSTLKKIEEFML